MEEAEKVPARGQAGEKHGQVKIKQFGKDSFSIGHETVDLKYVEQISDSEQTTALSYVLKTVLERLEERPNQDIEYLTESIWKEIRQKGLKCLVHGSYLPVSMAEVRRQEIYACINRYRGYRKQ